MAANMSLVTGAVLAVMLVAIAVVVYFEMQRASPAKAKKAAAPKPDAPKPAPHVAAPVAAPAAPVTHKGGELHDAFAEVDVDHSLTRVAPAQGSSVDDSYWLNEFHDAEDTAFRPIDKEQAKASANTRPAQQMQNGRDDHKAKARTVGLSPMQFARKDIERPVDSDSCISFNDTDTRHVLIDKKTDCFATDSCPWN